MTRSEHNFPLRQSRLGPAEGRTGRDEHSQSTAVQAEQDKLRGEVRVSSDWAEEQARSECDSCCASFL